MSLKKLIHKKQLNKIIVNVSKRPDYLAINIYWDKLRSWYTGKSFSDKPVYLNYSQLSKEYNCSKETIRKRLAKLERLELIARNFEHRRSSNFRSYNHLGVFAWKKTPYFHSQFGVDRDKIKSLSNYTNYNYIKEKHKISRDHFTRGANSFLLNPVSSRGNATNNSSNEQIILHTADMRVKRRLGIQRLEDTKILKIYKFIEDIKSRKRQKPKKLGDFYPLKKHQYLILREGSGRVFGIDLMNEILLSMSRKLKDHKFYKESNFIKYMLKALKHEKREDSKTCCVYNAKVLSDQKQEKEERHRKTSYNIWDEVRKRLMLNNRAIGDSMEKNWLSRLSVNVNEASKKIYLKASSQFTKDYVEERILPELTKSAKYFGFNLTSVEY